jgi:hypothetical protein
VSNQTTQNQSPLDQDDGSSGFGVPKRGNAMIDFDLGTPATVVVDPYTEGPRTLTTSDEQTGLRSLDVDDLDELCPILLTDIEIVSTYTLHVAIYALQNPTPENVRRALYKIGTSGDCEEYIDSDTLMPLPVPEPSQWNDYLPPAQEGVES